MRRTTRFLIGVFLGGSSLGAYLLWIGVDKALGRAAGVTGWAVVVVGLLVALEAVVDALGVWASIRPLGDGLSPVQSVQFALAGDFFDTLSPAGPVSSEPIMARFIGVTTETSYSEALGVRGVAKYVKAGVQLFLSLVLAAGILVGGPDSGGLLSMLGGALLVLLAAGVLLIWGRGTVSRTAVGILTPIVRTLSNVYKEDPYGRETVVRAVDRFWMRVIRFRKRPELLGLIAVGGILEQVLTAVALWVALAGTGTTVALLPIIVLVPLPQAASIVPVPASLGAYDILLGGALAVATGAPAAGAAAAVLVVRTAAIPFALGVGGLAAAFLQGWRP